MRNPFMAGSDEAIDFDDDLYDVMIQREVDDATEVNAALGAFADGRAVGRQLGGPEMNPHPRGPMHTAWERGRLTALSERFQ